jgi:hypothetical protein
MRNVEDMVEDIGRPIVVATHPRSGTHLTIDLLRKQFEECKGWLWFGETPHHLYLNLDRLDEVTKPELTLAKAENILQRADRPIVKTHSQPTLDRFAGERLDFATSLLRVSDIIYVVRDVRDVMCSAHVWKQEYEPTARCSLSKFIRQDVGGRNRVEAWVDHVENWISIPKTHVLQFEHITSCPESTIDQLADWVQLDPLKVQPYLPDKNEWGGRWADYWRRLTRDFESTAITGRYKGKDPQDWGEVFTKEDRKFIEQEAGDLIKKMGYERNRQWVVRQP